MAGSAKSSHDGYVQEDSAPDQRNGGQPGPGPWYRPWPGTSDTPSRSDTPPRRGDGWSRPGNAAPRPGNAAPRPGNAAPRPGNAAPRPGEAAPRPGNPQDEPSHPGQWRHGGPPGSRRRTGINDLFNRLRHGQGDAGPLRRDPEDRLAGGVAGGLAARTGFDVTVVRIAFVLITVVSSGISVAVYVLAWLFVAAADADSSIAAKARNDRRGIALAAGVASILLAAVLIFRPSAMAGSPTWPGRR